MLNFFLWFVITYSYIYLCCQTYFILMKRKGKDFVIKNRKYESCLILFDAGFKPLYCSQVMENYADYIKVEGNAFYGITKDQALPGDKIVSVEDFLEEWNERKEKQNLAWYGRS